MICLLRSLLALPAGALGTSWKASAPQLGAYEGITDVKVQPAGANQLVVVTCRFERVDLPFRVVFDAAGKLAGRRQESRPAILPCEGNKPRLYSLEGKRGLGPGTATRGS